MATKLSSARLRQIIREEVQRVTLQEMRDDEVEKWAPDPEERTKSQTRREQAGRKIVDLVGSELKANPGAYGSARASYNSGEHGAGAGIAANTSLRGAFTLDDNAVFDPMLKGYVMNTLGISAHDAIVLLSSVGPQILALITAAAGL
jgi:hypothetical protein